MIRTNADYPKRIKERLVSRNEAYKDIKLSSIKAVIDFFTKNIEVVVFHKKHVSITDFLNIYPFSIKYFCNMYSKKRGKPLSQLTEELEALRNKYDVKK